MKFVTSKSAFLNLLEAGCFDVNHHTLPRLVHDVRRDRKAGHHAALSIVNDCAADCGENVGGESSNPSAAPEVAASDDDDGGDGDGEDDRRRPGRPRNTRNNTFPAAAEHFDRLPDSALVGIATVKALTSKSRATVYRWMDRGLFPRPCKIGTTHNLWRAGDIRRALSA